MGLFGNTKACSSCDGDGWKELYDGGPSPSLYGKAGCRSCGGSGEEHQSWYVKNMKKHGVYRKPDRFKKGSGKVKD